MSRARLSSRSSTMTTVFMVDLKRFRFDYDRPAVLPRWADRETVFNLCRSFLGCIMWSKQDPFQIQIRSVSLLSGPLQGWMPGKEPRKRSCRTSRMSAGYETLRIDLCQHRLTNSNLGRNWSLSFSEVSLYPIQSSPVQPDR